MVVYLLKEFLHDGDVEPLLEDAFDVLLRRKRPLLLMKILKIMQTRKVGLQQLAVHGITQP